MRHLLFLTLCSLSFFSCTKDSDINEKLDQALIEQLQSISPTGSEAYFILPASDDYSNIPQDPKNPLSAAKVKLGQLLFHETALGSNPKLLDGEYSYSCASCHQAGAGFQAGIKQGIGEGGMGYGRLGESRIPSPLYPIDSLDIQPIRSPTVLNVAYQEVMLWNGQFGATGLNLGTENSWTEGTPIVTNKLGYSGVETQAIAGLSVHRMGINQELINKGEYKNLFDQAFSNAPIDDRYSLENCGLAIAAYERTILANQSPFQNWLKNPGQAMSSSYKEGALLFFGKANCYQCHTGPALNSNAFYALGMNDLSGDGVYGNLDENVKKGRGAFTKDPIDDYKFKVPQLYSITQSPFYGHGGNFETIEEVISYKNEAKSQNSIVPSQQLASEFKALNLSQEEIIALTVFVQHALNDVNLDRYQPTSLPSGNCFPNNDAQSRIDLNCN